MRIRESDPLEIFTDREGEIILKKYSPIGEMTAFAKQYAESLAQVSGKIALIADRDQFIAAAGGLKNLLGKSISHRMEEKLNDREILLLSKADKNFVEIANEPLPDLTQYVSAPILAEGDVIGAVILAANNEKEKLGEVSPRCFAPGILYVMLWFANSARTVALCNDILSGGRGGKLVPFIHL